MVYEQKIECAERAAEMLGSLEPIDSIFAGGSLTAGLGNITSDVDLFLLVKDKTQFEETWQSIDRGNRIDVEVYTLDELGQALRESCETKFAPARSGIVGIWSSHSISFQGLPMPGSLNSRMRYLNCKII